MCRVVPSHQHSHCVCKIELKQAEQTKCTKRNRYNRREETMARELSPCLKILWVWTLGTAAGTLSPLSPSLISHTYILINIHNWIGYVFLLVLVTSVVRTRVRDMENLMNAEQQQQQQHNTATDTDTLLVDTSPQSSELIREDKP